MMLGENVPEQDTERRGASNGPKVSVVIPCYNSASFIRVSLDSIRAQTVTPVEILVVDDGSTDDIEKVLADYPEVTLVKKPNGGPSTARNLGIRQAKGDIIMMLDSDDEWFPSKIEAHLKVWEREPTSAFVFDTAQRVRPNGAEAGVAGFGPEGWVTWEDMTHDANWTCGSTPSFRKEDAIAVGGYAEEVRFCEDVAILIQLGHKFGPGYRIQASRTRYHLRPESFSKSENASIASLQILMSTLPFLQPEHRARLTNTLLFHVAMYAPAGKMLKILRPTFPGSLKDVRLYKWIIIRALHFTGLRKL
jgi:glycosyltransferase involved in cell wall biosynthesis